MSDVIITVENLSKRYRLGQIGATSLRESAEHWWHKMRGRDPEEHMGEVGRKAEGGNLKPEVGEVGRKAEGGHPSSFESQVSKSSVSSVSLCESSQVSGLSPHPSDFVWALKDVSFEVKRGEVLGIIGKNGAGKSTLLKILSRITDPTSGRAILRGRVGSLLEVGTGFHPELTGRENIFLNGAILGMKKREVTAKFDEIVAFSEVEKFIDTPVKRYSSGMYVRLAFAVAAHLDPEILVVDEVLAVGDAQFQKKCLGKMGDVAKQGRTVLFVSHNMGAIIKLCEKCILLKDGILDYYGNTELVTSRYLSVGVVSNGLRVWPDGFSEPGVLEFRFNSVKLVDNEGHESASFDIRYPIVIEIDYTITKTIRDLQLGIVISTMDGTYVFQSFDIDQSGQSVERSPGGYISRCCLPGRFLNYGNFSLSVYADIKNKKVLANCSQALCFEVQDTETLGPYPTRVGFVRPVLDWTICARSEKSSH